MTRRERDRLISDKEFEEQVRKEMQVKGGLPIKEVKLNPKPRPKIFSDSQFILNN